MGRPKLFIILTSIGHALDIDAEDMEGYNSLIKIQANRSPTMCIDLLSARVNIKEDISLSTAGGATLRELMAAGHEYQEK
eukprot:4286285-Pyramimonas_sp.AAC.1